MSANLNVTNPARRKKALLVAANPATSTFAEAGWEVEIRSPEGGDLAADGYGDPEDPSGDSAHDLVGLRFKKSPAHAARLVLEAVGR